MPPSDVTARSRIARGAAAAAAAAALGSIVMLAGAAAPFVPDSQPIGWVTRPALSSYNLASGEEAIFRADFRAGEWSGSLRASDIDEYGYIGGGSPWAVPDAGVQLDVANFDTGRRIVTRHATTGAGVPFRWASLAAAQQSALGDATKGPKILNFVRGDRSHEDPNGDKFRKRMSVLGDIQHSTLLHWRHGGGQRRLYVGANDGMLHVFDATTGAEVFAYVPSMLIPKLPQLAARPYVPRLFVDGPLSIADVALAGGTRTLLVGGLGGGGRGLFMLDMTNPDAADEAAAAAKVKWEITPASTGFANLGFTYAMPRLGRLNHGVAAVIVGNGYLSTSPGDGKASLFVIDADTGALIREIPTGAGSAASPNGLSSPTLVDTNNDGKVDFAYAGDLDGTLWKFDLRAADPAGYTATALFTTSPAQAITVAPVVHPHPLGGHMVLFGTGRTLAPADATDTATFAAYGIWDGAPAGNTALLAQTLTETNFGTAKLRYASANVPDWGAGGHRGWRVALPAGERVVGEAPFLNDNRYYFMSANPTKAAASETQPPGEAWLQELDYLTGGNVPASIFDVNGDDEIDDKDKVDGQVIIGRWLGAGLHSQPVLVDLKKRSTTLFNQQSGLEIDLPSGGEGDPGVSGGHFDVDLYDRRDGTYKNRRHVHEYDDKYDVTGVNFLNASDATFNLSNAITNTTTPFKVLVLNQYLNPASQLSVGGQPFVNVKAYRDLVTAATAAQVLDRLPNYTRANVGTLTFRLPLDAFKSKDWWGNGDVRAGLIPTQTGCVNKINTSGVNTRPGPNGERYNGALTIQLIRADTAANDLELNFAGGGPAYGWRVKASSASKILAEYTLFWHHDNGKCYGDAGWVKDPPQDFGPPGKKATPAAGSADPKDGSFGGAPPPPGVTATGVTSSIVGNVTTYIVTYSDGTTAKTEIIDNGDGTETVRVTDRDGNVEETTRSVGSTTIRGAEEILAGSRRINWREVTRP